jgi:ABC-type nickel/cobalt efflux system permease component RcnA
MVSLATGLLLGFLLGIRHALEPDHLAAVSVLVARRGHAGAGAALGALWGVGHSLALLAVGCALAAMGSRLPPRLADAFEVLVAAMLVTLGARAILRARLGRHHADDERLPGTRWAIARRPLLVGLIHGLAGSGALTALALAGLPTVTTRLLYIVLFGVGSVVGMACLTGLAGWPLTRVAANQGLSRWLSTATGTFSLLLGAAWGWSALRALLGA